MQDSRRDGLAACLMLCAVLAACVREEAPVESAPPAFDEQGVVNETWRILKMATAHDVITLEVEVADLGTASDVARELMAPLESRYAEALIYVYAAGAAEGGIVAMEY